MSISGKPMSQRGVRLTQREVDVLMRIGEGYSSQEVADSFFISKRTIDFHLNNVYEKLEVKNRVQAFRVAIRFGLIPYEPRLGFLDPM